MIKTFQSNLKSISIISYAVKCLILNLFIYLITFPPCSIQIIQLMTRIFHLFHYEILFPLLIWHSDHPVDSTDSLSVKMKFYTCRCILNSVPCSGCQECHSHTRIWPPSSPKLFRALARAESCGAGNCFIYHLSYHPRD